MKTTLSLYVRKALLSMPIQFFFGASNRENICDVYHIFLQYCYDQCTLIRSADNLVKL